MNLTIEVPVSGPYFEGHFPGRPILPAVGLVDLVSRSLASAGLPNGLGAVERLRLSRIVAPGDHLALDVEPLAGDRVRFETRRGAESVARGLLRLGGPVSGIGSSSVTGSGSAARAPRDRSVPPDLDDLLPHRPPMRFVEGIEAETAEGVTCAVRVPAASAFDIGGSAPAIVALEMGAQAAAASEALRRWRAGGEAGPRVGYLVGARDVHFTCARLPVAESFLVTVRLSGMALPLCTYDFEVAPVGAAPESGREPVARGTLSTWLTTTTA